MAYPVQLFMSLVFIIQMYLMMVLMALFYTPFALFSREWAFRAVHAYTGWVRWTAGWMVGLHSEIRGIPPTGEVIIASKHQSFFDIIMIVHAVPRPKFIMKKEILWTPIVGFYAKRIGCISVDRGKRSLAIKKMVVDVNSGTQLPGQLIIFPQGTRVAAGARRAYKIGTAVLYNETGQACVPAATNVGVFWPRHGIMRKPGLAVVEFLPAIEQGLSTDDFMAELEAVVENNSDRLMVDAGLVIKG
ncbi:MAG: lysophospholipid acyltransferase family protein [Rhodobacterales bacterium]|jgi:1-acyl-sn-glycerol-3-phosphate acyltransferase|nr:lysophospholipid acyltransferase family protein [Pseudomonadota bacterium]MDA1286064.1 lysophospholipid acyltransferase family protein [Pseudomonadota bacterium]NQW15315.1 1-acyl-sn-glycerol-3-phosphate acyltransferase [Rhodobacter sp.]HBN30143.1 1-acyl-sn-glycerol-3-phosphate acyltransferase [Paracoccaceae bacterium]